MSTLTRRTALALTGSGLTAALAGVAVAAAQLPGVQSLIEAHRTAVAFADVQWDAMSELIDANPDVDNMFARVQVGRLLLTGKDDDGNDRWKPLYAADEEEIDKYCDRDSSAMLSIWTHGPGGEKRAEEIRAKSDARRERLKAELHRQQAEKKAAEDACGITAAHDAAKAASAIVKARLDDLMAYPCREISEVTTLAAYLVECEANGIEGIDTDTAFVDWVRALAGKAVQS